MIRKATEADLHELILLGFEQYHEERAYEFGFDYQCIPSLGTIKNLLKEIGGVIFVLELNGKIEGFSLWQIISSVVAQMQPIFNETGLYVKKEHRGAGWGGELIKAGERYLASFGGGLLSLGIHATGSPEYLQKHYESKEYKLFQMLFMKEISPLKKED